MERSIGDVINQMVYYICPVMRPALIMRESALDATFSALADPTRRAILTRLAHGPATVNELASPFNMSLPAVSKHLKVLERARLIQRGKEAQWRPCTLRVEPLKEADAWIEQYKRMWQDRFGRLDAYLMEVQAAVVPDREGAKKRVAGRKLRT
jgi:DNA-binding transcriptional ArsR family regulator